jgi:hypothetical protein
VPWTNGGPSNGGGNKNANNNNNNGNTNGNDNNQEYVETVAMARATTALPLSALLSKTTMTTCLGSCTNLSVPTKYHTQFKSMLDAMSTQGGANDLHPCVSTMVAKELFPEVTTGNYPVDQKVTVKTQPQGHVVCALFLRLADPIRFGDLQLKLKDDYYIHGVNNFPGSLQEAVTLMQAYENNGPKLRHTSSTVSIIII